MIKQLCLLFVSILLGGCSLFTSEQKATVAERESASRENFSTKGEQSGGQRGLSTSAPEIPPLPQSKRRAPADSRTGSPGSVYHPQSSANCLPKNHNIDGSKAHVITGVGNTRQEAMLDLQKKAPQRGLLKRMKLKSVKMRQGERYSEYNKLSSDLNVSLSSLNKYGCLINGKAAVTVTIPKSGVSYLPRVLRDTQVSKKAPNFLDEDKVNNLCADGLETYVFIIHESLQARLKTRGKNTIHEQEINIKNHTDYGLYVTCGHTIFRYHNEFPKGHTPWVKKEFWGDNFKMYYVHSTRHANDPFVDYTEEWLMQMQYNSMMLE